MSPMDPARYLDLFVAEAREHLGRTAELAGRIGDEPANGPTLRDLFRHLHSLKGMAATMGFPAMKELAHAAESLLAALREERVPARGMHAPLLAEVAACLERQVGRAEVGGPVEDAAAAGLMRALRRAASVSGDSPAIPCAAPAAETSGSTSPHTWHVHMILDREKPFPALQAALVLGRLAALGHVVSSDPPMALLRTGRFDGRLAAVLRSERHARALAAELARLEAVETFSLVPAPHAPEAPRRSPERWVRVRADVLDRLMEDAQDLSRPRSDARGGERTRALARRLQRHVTEARLIPFESAAQRLDRGARELARALGKTVRLEVEGRDVRVDRALLDHMLDPLLHLVRNAIDHGLEGPDERRAAGKPPHGTLRLKVVRGGDAIHIQVEDDGRGLDPDALRRAAVERGFLSAAHAARLGDAEAFLLAALPGLSTAPGRSEVSGRGVGLDVVKGSLEEIGGRLAIDRAAGGGTRITLFLPLTLSLIQALLVRCGGETFALPAAGIRRAAPADAALENGARELAEILGVAPAPPSPRRAALEFVAQRGGVLVVDEVVGRTEIVVRPVAPALLGTGIYSGAALLDDGSIVPVLENADGALFRAGR